MLVKDDTTINCHAHQTPQFRVLSDQQIKKVFEATLECLQRTGVNVLNDVARDLLTEKQMNYSLYRSGAVAGSHETCCPGPARS
jgi:trimethylamine:corrinoid methyltransferase-like protein